MGRIKKKYTGLWAISILKEAGGGLTSAQIRDRMFDQCEKGAARFRAIPDTGTIGNQLKRHGASQSKNKMWYFGEIPGEGPEEKQHLTEEENSRVIMALMEAGKAVSVGWLIEKVQDQHLTEERVLAFLEGHEDAFKTAVDKWFHRNNVPDWWDVEKKK